MAHSKMSAVSDAQNKRQVRQESSGFLKKPETQQQQKGEMLARESATREDVQSTEKRPWYHRKETSGMM